MAAQDQEWREGWITKGSRKLRVVMEMFCILIDTTHQFSHCERKQYVVQKSLFDKVDKIGSKIKNMHHSADFIGQGTKLNAF